MEDLSKYLEPTYFVDSDSYQVKKLAENLTIGAKTNREKTIEIFYWTRDKILYDPYKSFSSRKSWYKASNTIERGQGWCVQKAVVLAALGRALEIPSRLHFADIRNHQLSGKQFEAMKTNVFVYHGYTEFYIDGIWIKATPAFNKTLCEKINVPPVEYDGIQHAVLAEKTLNGENYIEYLGDRGYDFDLPFKLIFKTFFEYYF